MMANSSLYKPTENQGSEKPKPDPDRSVDEVITDGIEGNDEPIGENHPAAPFAIIFGAYPLFLIGALVLALAFIAWWARN